MTYSIIQKSQLEGALRLDAEYYQPEYLSYAKRILTKSRRLGDLVEFVRHPAEIERVYEDNGVPFLLTQNIKKEDFVLDFTAEKFISRERAKMIFRNLLIPGDVVVTRTGANYGDSAIYFGHPENLFASAHILIIRTQKVSGEYLAAYLNTKIGRSLMDRGVYGGLQPEITPEYIKTIPVPLVSGAEENYIKDCVKKAYRKLGNAKEFYHQAEDLLLEELGLKDFEMGDSLFSIVHLSDVQKANRVDAEFFQPKYEKLISKLKSQNAKLLDDLVSMKKGFEPGAETYQEEGRSFIRVSNISKQGIVDDDQKYLSEDLYQKLKSAYRPEDGEILMTKDATPGIAFVLGEQIDGIISSGILRLKLKKELEPEYLALVLNSTVGQMQAERDAGGSIIAHWKPEQIKNILIPILPQTTQRKIAELVRQSHLARQKSKELLDEAKRKVEEIIEKGCRTD